jgi:hypothetical protein
MLFYSVVQGLFQYSGANKLISFWVAHGCHHCTNFITFHLAYTWMCLIRHCWDLVVGSAVLEMINLSSVQF